MSLHPPPGKTFNSTSVQTYLTSNTGNGLSLVIWNRSENGLFKKAVDGAGTEKPTKNGNTLPIAAITESATPMFFRAFRNRLRGVWVVGGMGASCRDRPVDGGRVRFCLRFLRLGLPLIELLSYHASSSFRCQT